MVENVYVTVALRSDFVERMIETLYEYTPHNFKVVLIDQTLNGLPDIKGVHMKIRPHRNLGFGKAMNEGILHGLHWGSKYITCINDDIEMINKRWWDGIVDTFNMESVNEILAVNPESARIPLWGYGDTEGKYVEILPYKEKFTEEDYDYLLKGDFKDVKEKDPTLPKSFPDNYVGVCDGIAAWGPVFKRKFFEVIGLWDERFYPGGAEDYDMLGRVYSRKYRAVSTRSSWVWHWWGVSKDQRAKAQETGMKIEHERCWQDLTYLWPPSENEGNNFDVWGKYTGKDGVKKPFKRRGEIAVVEI